MQEEINMLRDVLSKRSEDIGSGSSQPGGRKEKEVDVEKPTSPKQINHVPLDYSQSSKANVMQLPYVNLGKPPQFDDIELHGLGIQDKIVSYCGKMLGSCRCGYKNTQRG